MIILHATEIQVISAGKALVDGVSTHLHSGDVLLLCGHNGSGKTTFLRVLAFHGVPTSGTYAVIVNGNQLNPQEAKRIIGAQVGEIVYFKNSTPTSTLESQMGMFGKQCDIETTLADFNLFHLKDQDCTQLSKGERKRLGLARAFCTDPQILLLDEPESGLDEKSFTNLLTKVQRNKERGGIAVIATHAPDRFADFLPQRMNFLQGAVYAAE